jgi:predicted component of type VI protein secretion system
VRLRRTSNLKEEEYVLIYRHAFIGSSPTESAVALSDYTLKPRHARIIYLSNIFWLENLAKHGAVQVDDRPIALREMVPLEPGMKIQIGEIPLRFESAEQIGINT